MPDTAATPCAHIAVSVARRVRTGLTHLVRHRPLAIATLAGTLSQLGAGAIPVAAVAIALERVGDVAAAGWIVTALAIGGLIGAAGEQPSGRPRGGSPST